jgi:hypothetical protein
MQVRFKNMYEEKTKASGVAKGGLTTGIIGTSLAGLLWAGASGMGNGNGLLGGLFGNGGRDVNHYCQSFEGRIGQLEAALAQVTAEKYADDVGVEVYKAGVANYKELDNKINTNLEKLYGFVIDLDKRTALNTQALHYENIITNNKIDCCCDKANMKIDFNKQFSELADAAIISYVNSTFIPGKLVLPASSICPPVVTQ